MYNDDYEDPSVQGTEEEHEDQLEPIAIIGLGGRYPDAPDLDTFWENLKAGRDCITIFKADHPEVAEFDPAVLAKPDFFVSEAILEDVDKFDAAFFGLSPREAEIMDPQHRLFLEVAWGVMESAGYVPHEDGEHIGIFAGCGLSNYLVRNLLKSGHILKSSNSFETLVGNSQDSIATRTAHRLGLEGPAVSMNTMCSTSLVAIQLACQSLYDYKTDMCLAGGTTIQTSRLDSFFYREGGIGSRDGAVRTFDEGASGTVSGNGVGVVMLKRLSDALEDRDPIHAVIRSAAINNDAARKNSYSAPSEAGQHSVITEALLLADIPKESVSYVEAHGTATQVGDVIEVSALKKAYGGEDIPKQHCAIGSVKTNIGHPVAAAGVAGVTKCVLSMKNRQLVPSINYESPNPALDLENSPFHVNTEVKEWKPTEGYPLRAAVSSFGIGGTNAHVILEEAPVAQASGPGRDYELVLLSGRTETAAQEQAANLLNHLEKEPETNLHDLAFTLQRGRTRFEHRLALVTQSTEDLKTQLAAEDLEHRIGQGRKDTEVVFLFSGQGSQYPNMARDLYESEPIFKAALDACDGILQEHMEGGILKTIFPDVNDEAAAAKLRDTRYTQPALFSISYALAKTFMTFGIEPTAMMGHSVGEYVAAHLAGILALEDALKLVALRGALISDLPEGDMLAVPLSVSELGTDLRKGLDLAALNTGDSCVVSGKAEAIAALKASLAERGVEARDLHTSHAFHSAMMDPILETFREEVAALELNEPELPYISNVSGTWITAEQATDPNYYVQHLRGTVRFYDGLDKLASPYRTLLEVGPGNVLASFAKRSVEAGAIVGSVRHPKEDVNDAAYFQRCLGQLWKAGARIDWDAVHEDEERNRIPLPTYPFQRKSFYVEPDAAQHFVAQTQQLVDGLLPKQEEAHWYYLPSWKRSLAPAAGVSKGKLLIFAGSDALSTALLAHVGDSDAVVVTEGDVFTTTDAGFALRPSEKDDYDALLAALDAPPAAVIWLWTLTAPDATAGADALRPLADRCFLGLSWLAAGLNELCAARSETARAGITIVTDRAHILARQSKARPSQALVTGPLRVIPQECERLWARQVDVDAAATRPAKQEARLLDALLREARTERSDTLVAYRGTQRYVATVEKTTLAEGSPSALRQGGTYLITGGMGGIGLAISRFLARSYAAKLLLVGRSPLPPKSQWATEADHNEKVRALLDLEEMGGSVAYVSADVADAAAMGEALAQTQTRFGGLNGVIHAAGLAGGGVLALKEREAVLNTWQAKVVGAQVLLDATADLDLDFVAFFSSIASLGGGYGQSDYTSANAYLDALAWEAREQGQPVISINWDAWKEAGMAEAALQTFGPSHASDVPEGTRIDTTHFDYEHIEGHSHIYTTDFTQERHWVFREHRAATRGLLPGTGYLDMAQKAFSRATGQEAFEVQEFYFMKPFWTPEDQHQRGMMTLSGSDGNYDFKLTSEDGKGQTDMHGMGQLRRATTQGMYHDHESYMARSTVKRITFDNDTFREMFGNRRETLLGQFEFGPRWTCLKSIAIGEGCGVAHMKLADSFLGDLKDHGLHPAMLDNATAFLPAFDTSIEGYYIPFGYKNFTLHGPLPQEFYSFAQRIEPDKPDQICYRIVFYTPDGEEVAVIERFMMTQFDRDMLFREEESDDSAENTFQKFFHDYFLAHALTLDEGTTAFDAILSNDPTQILLSTRDFEALLQHDLLGKIPKASEASGKGGKLDRSNIGATYVAPRNPVEEGLVQMLEEIMGVSPIGVQDNFMDLGGDSLVASRLLAKVRLAFDVDLSPSVLFDEPTLEGLAGIVLTTQMAAGAADDDGDEDMEEGDFLDFDDEEEGEI